MWCYILPVFMGFPVVLPGLVWPRKYQQPRIANKKTKAVSIDLLECPVCMKIMTPPIFQCQSGHNLCNDCTQNLLPLTCPICRQNLTQMRNWQLEEIIDKAKVECPNKSSGCVFTMVSIDLEEHLKECIFREMDCPLGAVFGKCSWTGKYQQPRMANKKAKTVLIDLPECPVCMKNMTAPIFQCQTGHSLCNSCTQNLLPLTCPICRQNLTQMRNWQLEEIIAKAKVECPNKSSGCVFTMVSVDLEEHLKECIFREMDCPLGAVFGKCSWTGKLKDMMEHFKDRHASHCNITTDEEVELTNVDIKNDDRHFFLVAHTKFLFILTVKIDTLQNMVYWTIQRIGNNKKAHDFFYEIHVVSKQNPRRKVMFTEHCFNDSIKPDEIFRQGKCAVLPLEVLEHFIKDKKLSFRFFIKRIPPPPGKYRPKGPKNAEGI